MSTGHLERETVRAGASIGQTRSTARRLAEFGALAPALLLMAVFLAGPIAYSLYGSLTNQAMTGIRAAEPQFVGLDNYKALLGAPEFWKSVLLTVVFVLASAVIGQNVLGMSVALLMRRVPRWVATCVGTIVIIAWVLPEIVAAFALYAFFQKDGMLNSFLEMIGLHGPSWLIGFPMLSVIIANIWRGTAFSMMVYAAALSNVPADVQEAAMIDGAGGWQRLIHVTIPIIKGSISTNLLLTTLQTLGVFTLIWVMTGGGPGTQSSTLPVLAFQRAFKFSQVGYGTAIATVTLILGALFALVYIKVLKPEVD